MGLRPSSWPLWVQITLGMLVIAALVALGAGELVRHLERDQLQGVAREEAGRVLAVLAATSLEAVITEDIPQLETVVAQAGATDLGVQALVVTNEAGVELVRWQRPGASPAQRLTRTQEVALAGEAFGRIEVALDMDGRYAEVERRVERTRVLSVTLLLVLTAALLVFVQLLVVRPLLRIERRVHALTGGELEGELRVGSSRDFALLARSVDDLAAALRQEEARKRELREAKEAAEAASQAKSRFLSSMSHELRTPMNAVLGFAQILATDTFEPLTEGQADSVGEILKAGRHLLELINDVLDLSRIEAGRLTMEPEPLDPAALVAEALALVAPLAERFGVTLEAAPGGARARVLADRLRLKQVLLNLLSNAIKYNRPGGRVLLAGPYLEGGEVRIRVDDTGPGLTPEQQVRIFEPFVRLDESGTIEGTGIGLTISRRLMRMMDGTIGVESTPGQGSRFWIGLPDRGGAVPAPAAPPPAPTGPDCPGCLVLYIEDQPTNQRLVEILTRERAGLRLVTAQQGAIGLELARAHRPALILLDLHLPDIDGFEVRRRLLDAPDTRAIPVVVVSADATADSIARARDLGMTHYFTKPVDPARLLACMDDLLTGAGGPAAPLK